MRALPALLLAALALAGCATVERGSTTGQPAPAVRIDSAARVSRLLFVPPVVSREGCGPVGESFDQPNDPSIDVAAVAAWLADWKDYAVTTATRSADSDRLVTDLASWHQQLSSDAPLPEALRAQLGAWAAATGGLDDSTALLLIRSHQRCVTTTDVALYFLFVGMPRYFALLFERNTSIALYAAGSGRLLWMAYFNAAPANAPGLQQRVLAELENLPAAAVQRSGMQSP